ncbi:MAG TPA: Maf family protein [Ilumatobacteraceae bacterium]|nr:Maf family protein [Ilumatobacteraceae bacterium]
MRVILGSSSVRRRELLGSLGVAFDLASPDIEETPLADESAETYVLRLASEKAAAIESGDDDVVIAADTTVVLNGEIIGKPVDRADAVRILSSLAGQTHQVLTGVAIAHAGRVAAAVETTLVTFTPLSAATIEWYVDHHEVLDKAGAYGMQGAAGAFVERIDGSPSNVIGLPLHLVVALAERLSVNLLA